MQTEFSEDYGYVEVQRIYAMSQAYALRRQANSQIVTALEWAECIFKGMAGSLIYNAVKRRETVYGSNFPVHNPCSTTQASPSLFPSVYYMPEEAYIVKAHASISIPGSWPFASLLFFSSVSKRNSTSRCWVSSTFLENEETNHQS